MIDTKKYKEVQIFEPEGAIILFTEKDFLEFAEVQENRRYLFFVKEYHPEDEDKIIAHDCYVFDVISCHWFNYQDILIDQDAYDKLHEDVEEEVEGTPEGGTVDSTKINFLKEYLTEQKISNRHDIEIVNLVRYAREKKIKCPFTENDRWTISRLIESEPELDDIIQKHEEEVEKEMLGKVEEIANEIAKLQTYRDAPTVNMKKMIIKKYLLENGHGKMVYPATITNIKDLADIKQHNRLGAF